MIYRSAYFFSILLFQAVAQPPEVPHKMTVAGITLTIRDDARKEIQEDVNALTRSARHFDIKVQRARTYFPLIESILREERVPDDFKYLVLQESALIPDAVSVSNAVGYWQFKDFTAQEMGLRMDEHVDERMNIIASTRAAARYLKKNNYYFNNWIYALQAYQMGAGAVLRSVHDYQSGTRHMEITSATYWYVKKFLAHKVAFEQAINGPAEVKLVAVEVQNRKTLQQLAQELQVNHEDLLAYNMWMRKSILPDENTYTVLVPVRNELPAPVLTSAVSHQAKTQPDTQNPDRIVRNGIPALIAAETDTWATLAARAGISLRQLLRYNDCSITDKVTAGSWYYIKPKNKRSNQAALHVVQSGESLWNISQHYGVALKTIRKLNPDITLAPSPGTQVYLVRTVKNETIVQNNKQIVGIDAEAPFDWSFQPPSELVAVAEPVANPDASAHQPPVTETAVPAGMHRVQSGETVYGIARKYNLSVQDLLNWNNLVPAQAIRPGQMLRLLPPESSKAVTEPTASDAHGISRVESPEKPSGIIWYEVKPSDTLYSIARQHGVTIKELMEWNGKKDFAVVPGEKLKIAGK